MPTKPFGGVPSDSFAPPWSATAARTISRRLLTTSLSLLFLVLFAAPVATFAEAPAATVAPAAIEAGQTHHSRISPIQAMWVGRKIWQNECEGTISGLTFWNAGESFPSLGIGHFIWYIREGQERFQESFPGLVEFCRDRGVAVPAWLLASRFCPWPDKAAFDADRNSPRMRELRKFLAATISVQTEFIAQRLLAALPRMCESLGAEERRIVTARFEALFRTPQGLYALMDYVNFKGEGVNPAERYAGQGWGMLQVLQGMQGLPAGLDAVREFGASARRMLERRVANCPAERRKTEEKFLNGWRKRVDGYAASDAGPGKP